MAGHYVFPLAIRVSVHPPYHGHPFICLSAVLQHLVSDFIFKLGACLFIGLWFGVSRLGLSMGKYHCLLIESLSFPMTFGQPRENIISRNLRPTLPKCFLYDLD